MEYYIYIYIYIYLPMYLYNNNKITADVGYMVIEMKRSIT